ncbi:IS3 family transposase [Leuconostoc mesenteroides]|uniref:IS3 family transposase n=3 Tax=Leuconostoc mesenteroides TaxID=1245 RepID=UPI00236233DF|nr:IS3 family transposase [Leuconostoc mesenteroides]
MGLPLVNQFLAQGYALVRILSALKIKPSTYYDWRHWQPSQQEKRRESLKPYILDVWKTFKFYGYRRIAAYSQQTDGPKVSEYMTLKLMRELGNKSRMQKRYRKPKTVVTVDQKPNLIRHLHDLSGVWQTDITYIQLTNHRWVYLATVLDPEKRKVLGYKIGDTMTAELATSALQMALDKHRKPLIIHSDMGSQYTSAEFNIKCQNYGLKHSYSLKGHPYDNGRMEAFHSILKREEVYLKAYQTLTEVQAAIGWYINFYNRNRISNVA